MPKPQPRERERRDAPNRFCIQSGAREILGHCTQTLFLTRHEPNSVNNLDLLKS